LIRAAHLQDAAVALVEFDEVIALQDHVVELQEGERLLALEPQFHAVHGQHAIDREVPADLAQERDVPEARQPIIVIDHERAGGAVVEAQVVTEDLADAGNVGVDLLVGEKLARFVAPRRIPHFGGAAPISTMGRCPVCCRRRSSMICTRLPTCRLSAVASNPMYAVTMPETARWSSAPGQSVDGCTRAR